MKSIKELLTNKPINEGGTLNYPDTIRYKGKEIDFDDLEVDWNDGYDDKTLSFWEFLDEFVDNCQSIFG